MTINSQILLFTRVELLHLAGAGLQLLEDLLHLGLHLGHLLAHVADVDVVLVARVVGVLRGVVILAALGVRVVDLSLNIVSCMSRYI